jgi:hypothetical protein
MTATWCRECDRRIPAGKRPDGRGILRDEDFCASCGRDRSPDACHKLPVKLTDTQSACELRLRAAP